MMRPRRRRDRIGQDWALKLTMYRISRTPASTTIAETAPMPPAAPGVTPLPGPDPAPRTGRTREPASAGEAAQARKEAHEDEDPEHEPDARERLRQRSR